MLGLRNRDTLDGPTLDEFENLVAQLRSFLLVSFEETGELRVTTPITNLVPTGSVVAWTTNTPPTGWLICDGSQVARVDYKTLFDLIGTTYGPGDGVLTFNLPDLRGRFPLGKATAGTGAILAATGGNIDHTHSSGAHTHTIAAHSHTGPSHTHSISSDGSHSHGGATASDGAHTHTFSGTTNAGNSFQVVTNGFDTNVAKSDHTHTFSGTTDSGGSHTHGISSDGSHSHGGATGAEGTGATSSVALTTDSASGTTGTANPPFQVFNYIIRT